MTLRFGQNINIEHQKSNLVEDYAGGACRKANFFAEWIYLPNAYGKGIHFDNWFNGSHLRSTFGREIIKWKFWNRDKTFEDIEDRLHELDEDENLTQQQMNFICFFIFPNCASKQKQMIHIGKGYSIPFSTVYRIPFA